MPIYEYRCQDCRKVSSIFVRSVSSTVEPSCQHCNGQSLDRLISRVAVLRSAQEIYNDYDRMSWVDDIDDGGDDPFDGRGDYLTENL